MHSLCAQGNEVQDLRAEAVSAEAPQITMNLYDRKYPAGVS